MKKITMKNSAVSSWSRVVAIGSIASLALLTACGDNVTDNDPVATQAYEGQEDFPECDKDYEGMFATIKSKQELYICTAEKWVNLTTGQAVSDQDGSDKTGCTSKELANKSGVQVICNGDTVATLSYGKTGAKGSDGDTGDTGDKGTKGSDGSSFSGTTPTWDPDRCKLKNAGLDYMIYDCGDSTYVERLSNTISSTAPWMAINPSTATSAGVPTTSFNGYAISIVYNNLEGATGVLEGGDLGDITGDNLKDNDYVIAGTAKVSVTTAQTVSADEYRPFVGAKFTYGATGINISAKGGVCLTYSSEKDMNLLIQGETGFVRATLPATKDGDELKDTVVDLIWTSFTPVAKEVDWEKVLLKAKFAYVEAAGGEAVGEYINNFSVSQFGDYGKCDGATYKSWLRHLNSVIGAEGTITDSDGEEYKTIIIGEQQWLAENLRKNVGGTSTPTPCYVSSDDAANGCPQYGRKYTWEEALGSAATTYGCSNTTLCTSTLPEGVRGICPEGWHLPSYDDWKTLFNVVRDEPFNTMGYEFKDTKALAVNNNSHLFAQNLSKMNLYWDGADVYTFAFKESDATSAFSINFFNNKAYLGYYNAQKKTPRFLRCLRSAPTN